MAARSLYKRTRCYGSWFVDHSTARRSIEAEVRREVRFDVRYDQNYISFGSGAPDEDERREAEYLQWYEWLDQ